MAIPLTRANLRAMDQQTQLPTKNTLVGEKSQGNSSGSNGFDYMNTKPLAGYEVPAVYNYFGPNSIVENKPQNHNISKAHTAKKNLQRGQLPSIPHSVNISKDLSTASSSSPHKPWQRPIRPNDPVEADNRYEDVNITLDAHHRSRLVQNVSNYIRFFCGQVNHVYSLADIDDLIAHPVLLPLDLVEKNQDIWELLDYLFTCCKAAKIKPIQWFDILTQWKAKFQRSLTFSEFSVGLARLFEEVNAQPFTEPEIVKLFEYFQRNSQQSGSNQDSLSSSSTGALGTVHSIRRRDFQVGLKKKSLSKKRIEWFNHQAHILFKCHMFLEKIKLSFRDLNVEVVKSKNKKQSINTMELESMVSVLIGDYIAFVNCKHVDSLLAKEGKEKQMKNKAIQQQRQFEQEMQRLSSEKIKQRRTLDGSEGSIEIYDDSEDDGFFMSAADKNIDLEVVETKSVTSQLDIGDDISTLSVMDDMSEASNSARSTVAGGKHLLHKNVTGIRPFPVNKSTKRLEPLNLHALQHSGSDEEIVIDPSSNNGLTPAEIEQLQRLASSIQVSHDKLHAIKEEKFGLQRNRSSETFDSFIEERQKKSSALVRSHSIFRRYSQHASGSSKESVSDPMMSSDQAQVNGGSLASPTMKNNMSSHNLCKKQSSSNLSVLSGHPGTASSSTTHQSGIRSSDAIIPKEVVNDWYLRDDEFKKAQKQDPSLTPTVYQHEYKAFENAMQDKRNKHMQYYKSVTDHFDARVAQARKRLARARKTGI
jgi:hypothetical protein